MTFRKFLVVFTLEINRHIFSVLAPCTLNEVESDSD